MLIKDSVEWWQDLLDRYEAVRGRMTQVEFCEQEGVSHNAFVHRRLGISVARSTMVRLFHTSIERNLRPVADRNQQLIRQSEVVLADETPIQRHSQW